MEAADLVKEALALPDKCVLATIVHAEGHAYRKTGAMMLLKEGGGASGSLSPGCLEADLMAYVPAVLQQAAPQIVEYDMRSPDDSGWGEGIGCGGLVRIMLEPAAGPLKEALAQVHLLLERGSAAVLRRVTDAGLLPSGYAVEPADAGSIAEDAEREASPGARLGGGFMRELATRFEPKPRLVLFGAGDDAVPVSLLAQRAGFRVLVADFRPGFCRAERFPGAETARGFPAELEEILALAEPDYVVVMSHQFQRDGEFLELAMRARPHYLGIMGSVPRTERLLAGKAIPPGVCYPVGLPIGADGPEEIAFSIVAELISVRRGRGANGKTDGGGVVSGRGLRQPNGAEQAFDPAARNR